MVIIDLSGRWEVFPDKNKADTLPEKYPFEITLPNSTSNAEIGEVNRTINLGCLTDKYKFEGFAWYRRKITVPENVTGKSVTLFLERTRKTRVFLDGKAMGEYCSLCTPHRYSLDGITAGEHELIICVDNTDYPTAGGHLTSQDTQTNWNGIIGKIELWIYTSYADRVYIIPDIEKKSISVKAEIIGKQKGTAALSVYFANAKYSELNVDFNDNQPLCCEISLKDLPLWSSKSTKLLRLDIETNGSRRVVFFGLRRFYGKGRQLFINDEPVFLRGKHDGLVFPKTGFFPADLASWLKYFGILAEYGINHVRYHTCCPPEAAFQAADMLGFFLQPELPFWGTIPDTFGEEHEFLKQEGFRILAEYGHHPSFVMMSMGNELWGNKDRINELISGYKQIYPDKMYAGGSNNFQFVPCLLENEDFFSGVRLGHDRLIRGSYAMCDAPQGHIQTNYPNSIHNYDPLIDMESTEDFVEDNGGEILIQYGTEMKSVHAEAADNFTVDVPVITHEIGQYAMFPDFDEIREYTGSLKHTPYEFYRSELENAGMFHKWREFFLASGRLAADCYRLEIETAMLSGMLSGFQLLDLQDFPGQGVATVGILNAHMKSKGIITPEKWRQFCGEAVLAAVLNGFVYECGTEVLCGIQTASTRADLIGKKVEWELVCGNKKLNGGESEIFLQNGRVYIAKSISFTFECKKPMILKLNLKLEDIAENSYTLYFYPKINIKITDRTIVCGRKKVKISRNFLKAKAEGGIYIPKLDEKYLAGEYCTDFWCYGMFKSISESMNKPVPTGTLGLLIDSKSDLLNFFPSENYTTPQWFNIVMHSRCADLDGTDIEPDVWVIDNPERHKRLGLLYRKEDVICCTSRLWEISDRPEVKWFAKSLLEASYFEGE